jgi:hypothetical protein
MPAATPINPDRSTPLLVQLRDVEAELLGLENADQYQPREIMKQLTRKAHLLDLLRFELVTAVGKQRVRLLRDKTMPAHSLALDVAEKLSNALERCYGPGYLSHATTGGTT